MATITFNGQSYVVDHAAKGSDYIHGYNAAGEPIVTFDGIEDFSLFTYDDEYMDPTKCLGECCNNVKHVGGKLTRADGTVIVLPTEGGGGGGGFEPELYRFITGKHIAVQLSPANNFNELVRAKRARTISLSGDAESITVYDN